MHIILSLHYILQIIIILKLFILFQNSLFLGIIVDSMKKETHTQIDLP